MLLAGPPLCAAVILLAACGSGSSGPAPTTAAPPSNRVDSQVLASYTTMWADLVTAARTSDYQSPLLAEHATGGALTLLVQGLARDQLHGIVTLGRTVHFPRLTSLMPPVMPTHALISDCFDDSHWIEYQTSGARARNAPGGRRAATADLVKSGGTWKVSQISVQAVGSC
jgi:hypothetical protein